MHIQCRRVHSGYWSGERESRRAHSGYSRGARAYWVHTRYCTAARACCVCERSACMLRMRAERVQAAYASGARVPTCLIQRHICSSLIRGHISASADVCRALDTSADVCRALDTSTRICTSMSTHMLSSMRRRIEEYQETAAL